LNYDFQVTSEYNNNNNNPVPNTAVLHAPPPPQAPVERQAPSSNPHLPIVYDDTWLLEYRQLHAAILAGNAELVKQLSKAPPAVVLHNTKPSSSKQSASKDKQRMFVYACPGGCGGVGDRIIGMTNTLILAVLTDRAFMIQQRDNFV
jgi:hypothetical protein